MMEDTIDVLCVACRRSLRRIGGNRRRSITLTADFMESHQYLIAYCVEVININQFNGGERICRPCFQRAQRYVPQQQRAHTMDGNNQQPQIIEERHDEPVQEGNNSALAEPSIINQNVRDQAVQVNRMQAVDLPGYLRAPFNSQLCIYAHCNNNNLQRINIALRTTILQEKSFYIPRGSRVCEEHSNSVWQDIETNTRHVLSSFSPTMIKDMMDILKTASLF
ncbi:uncharacterized protein LOC121736251 [Aricia agestis]|uniref:uncharacterized protein LOC121736251 n=1 Tax=Aricia agestis TaxID=91739 RepID=UPI001C20A7D4|nr:uncharacterized protein LOC121736251 [Aricia agestis]